MYLKVVVRATINLTRAGCCQNITIRLTRAQTLDNFLCKNETLLIIMPQYRFKNTRAYVWKETYAVIKARKTNPKAFANIVDRDEITVIINQEMYDKKDSLAVEKGWKVITIDTVFTFDTVGVTARLASAFAKHGISILVVAAFSRDHFLVKKTNLGKTKKVLQDLGIKLYCL